MFCFAGHCPFVRKMYFGILLFDPFRDAVSVLLRGALFVHPTDVVYARAMWVRFTDTQVFGFAGRCSCVQNMWFGILLSDAFRGIVIVRLGARLISSICCLLDIFNLLCV